MRRTVLLLAGLALLAAACGTASSDATTPSSAATTATTQSTDEATSTTEAPPTTTADEDPTDSPIDTTVAGSVTIDFTTCDSAGEFAVLCEAYDVLTREYVDDLDDATLAAGAVRGIEEFTDGTRATSEAMVLQCPLPSESFEPTCEAAARTLSELDTSVESIAEAAVAGMFQHGLDDPNSQYLPPKVLERISEEQSGEISGIGSLVVTEQPGPDGEPERCNVISETCKMMIISVIDDGPAEGAGLQSGDVMVSVDGETLIGWTSEEIVAAVRGPAGEPVTLEIDRDGQILTFTIVRAPIVVPVTSTELYEGGVGYVELTQFTANSGTLFREAVQEVIDAGATRLIIDLQNNPGGALNAAIAVASQFLDDGLVLRTQGPDGETVYDVNSGGAATDDDLEILVVVNRGSASASEVVAGVLQETGRAVVMGENTFGKNTVQQQYGLSNGGAVKVTIARWVTPGGADLGEGVRPDVEVTIPDDAGTEFLIDRALDYFGVTTTA